MRVACILALLVASCAGAQMERYPQRRCLHSGDARGLVRPGNIIAKRDDGALLFQFDDQNAGDRGFMWIATENSARLRPCTVPRNPQLEPPPPLSAPELPERQ